MRVVEDFLRVDKRFFGLTGSQWTGLTVSVICLVTLAVWAIRAPHEPHVEPTEPRLRERLGGGSIGDGET
jgi:hypothetical protein